MDAYLEIGSKKVIAGLLEWPGLCRGAKEEQAALQALLDYGPRYARVLKLAKQRLDFKPPSGLDELQVVERLPGTATTDYGVPAQATGCDSDPLEGPELERLGNILSACWWAFREAIQAGAGKELRKGPRGGGRELDGIVAHVLEAERSYLSALGHKHPKSPDEDMQQALESSRLAALEGLEAAVQGRLPKTGPRGGARWLPGYFVRRSAWHLLDHAWEIEDRVLDGK